MSIFAQFARFLGVGWGGAGELLLLSLILTRYHCHLLRIEIQNAQLNLGFRQTTGIVL